MGSKDQMERAIPMADQSELALMTPAEELAVAKASADGCYLSPAAQALYETEGAARFAKFHGHGRSFPKNAEFCAAAEIGKSGSAASGQGGGV